MVGCATLGRPLRGALEAAVPCRAEPAWALEGSILMNWVA